MSYSSALKEVFIDPIRSVLAIDDEFPTLDELLSSGSATETQFAKTPHWNRLEKLLAFCRGPGRLWLIDVHNGKGQDDIEALPYRSMHQSDWLVIDYQLEGSDSKGTKALSILGKLASSKNFNLATIYTGQNLEDVFHDIVVEFSTPSKSNSLSDEDADFIGKAIDEWDCEDGDIIEKLLRCISIDTYLRLCDGTFLISDRRNSALVRDFLVAIEKNPPPVRLDNQKLLSFVLNTFEKEKGIVNRSGVSLVRRAKVSDMGCRWLVIGSLFVCIAQKSETEPSELLDHMQTCLESWKPSPNRLALAKLRVEMDASGLAMQNEVMSDRDMQSLWLVQLMGAKEWESRSQICTMVDRQTELLLSRVRASVVDYTQSLINSIKADGISARDSARVYFGSGFDDQKGRISHNTHVSTKEVSLSNLTTGHVLQLTEDGSLWLCISPSCDLVPERENERDLDGWIPFTALKLYLVSEAVALKEATFGHIIFLDLSGVKSQYSIYPEGNSRSNPQWGEYYAENEGKSVKAGDPIMLASLSAIHRPVLPVQGNEVCLSGAQAEVPVAEPPGNSVASSAAAETVAEAEAPVAELPTDAVASSAVAETVAEAVQVKSGSDPRAAMGPSSTVVVEEAIPEVRSDEGGEPIRFYESRVVAELRAEYANSLSQRFSAHLMRIGLEFLGNSQ